MAFRIREITVHLMGAAPGPCMPASPVTECPGGTCRASQPDCKGKSHKPAPGDDRPGGDKRRSLGVLRAQLREVMATL